MPVLFMSLFPFLPFTTWLFVGPCRRLPVTRQASLERLLAFLHLTTGLAVGALSLTLLLLLFALFMLWRTPMVWGLALGGLWALSALSGFRHLGAGLAVARGSGAFHGEVSEQVRHSGRRLLAAAGLSAAALPATLFGAQALTQGQAGIEAAELLSPSSVLGMLLTAAVPLLLLGLARWLDEGQKLQGRAREVV